ncbi:MAG: hypothetical protein ACK502_08745 [Alphaproteobacteria bacterium]
MLQRHGVDMVKENAQLATLMNSDLQIYEDTDFAWMPTNTLRIHVTGIPDMEASRQDVSAVIDVMKSLVTFYGGSESDVKAVVLEKGAFVEVSGEKAADVARVVRFAFPNMVGAASIPGGQRII